MESVETSHSRVANLEDYRRGIHPPSARAPGYDGDQQKLIGDLSRLAECILAAAEIISQLSLPSQF